jgi:riboflavin kinase/FMN adenylyltransferase
MGEMEGFGVDVFEPVTAEGHEKISSTQIREALKAGKPEVAAKLLGHFWTVESRVEHGDKRGRTVGFPTANMRLDEYLKPAYGIYAVRATVFENDEPASRHDGVASLGIRPMFESQAPLLETFLFDFEGDLYGKHLGVELISYLRPEAKLDSLDALVAQMNKDSDAAKKILKAL